MEYEIQFKIISFLRNILESKEVITENNIIIQPFFTEMKISIDNSFLQEISEIVNISNSVLRSSPNDLNEFINFAEYYLYNPRNPLENKEILLFYDKYLHLFVKLSNNYKSKPKSTRRSILSNYLITKINKNIISVILKYDYFISESLVTTIELDNEINFIDVSPDNEIVIGGFDGLISFYDTRLGKLVKTGSVENSIVENVGFLTDKRIVITSGSQFLKIVDANFTQILFNISTNSVIEYLIILPDDRIIIISLDSALYIFNPNTQETFIYKLQFSPNYVEKLNYNTIVLVSRNGDYIVYNVDDTTKSFTGKLSERITVLKCLDNTRFALGTNDGKLLIFNLTQPGITILAHTYAVKHIEKLFDNQIVTTSDDQTIRVWDYITGYNITFIRLNNRVYNITVLPDNRIATSGSGSILRIWNLDTGNTDMILEGHRDIVQDIKILSDGRIVSRSEDSIKIWE